jgi:hypothetical protein
MRHGKNDEELMGTMRYGYTILDRKPRDLDIDVKTTLTFL